MYFWHFRLNFEEKIINGPLFDSAFEGVLAIFPYYILQNPKVSMCFDCHEEPKCTHSGLQSQTELTPVFGAFRLSLDEANRRLWAFAECVCWTRILMIMYAIAFSKQ